MRVRKAVVTSSGRVVSGYDDTRIFGLFVGIDRYEQLPTLRGCANDARLLAQALAPISARSTVLTNEDATRTAILSVLEDLIADATEAGSGPTNFQVGRTNFLVVVFIGSHAMPKYDSLFVFPSDAKPDRVLSTGFAFADVTRALAATGVPSLIVADVCYAGTLGLEALTVHGAQQSLMMSACPGELSMEGADSQGQVHGYFSQALAQAFERAVAGDTEQGSTLRDAFDAAYLHTKTRSHSQQHPVFFGSLEIGLDLRCSSSIES